MNISIIQVKLYMSFEGLIFYYLSSRSYSRSFENSLNYLIILVLSKEKKIISDRYFTLKLGYVHRYILYFVKKGCLSNPSIFGGSADLVYTINFLKDYNFYGMKMNNVYLKQLIFKQYKHLSNQYLTESSLYLIDYVNGVGGSLTMLAHLALSESEIKEVRDLERKKIKKILNDMSKIDDFGFAHGLSGVFNSILTFEKYQKIYILKNTEAHLLINLFLRYSKRENGQLYWDLPNGLGKPKKMSWCYGSKIILHILLKICRNHNFKDYYGLLDSELKKLYKSQCIFDSMCFCHGYVGDRSIDKNIPLEKLEINVEKLIDEDYSQTLSDFLHGISGILFQLLDEKYNLQIIQKKINL